VCKQGEEPALGDKLLWVVTNENFWSPARENASSNYYKKPKFSVYLEELQNIKQTLQGAIKEWGNRPYGIIRITYFDIKNAGYIGVIEEENGNLSHVNISPDPDSKLSKNAKAQMLCEMSQVVRPWGREIESGEICAG
jgi:hypothetical protein